MDKMQDKTAVKGSTNKRTSNVPKSDQSRGMGAQKPKEKRR